MGIDGWWAKGITFWGSERGVAGCDAGVGDCAKVSANVGYTCVVHKDWHAALRFWGVGVLYAFVFCIGNCLAESVALL